MKTAKIILIVLFYLSILYGIYNVTKTHGSLIEIFGQEKKLLRLMYFGIVWTLFEGVVVSVLFYFAGIFNLS